jgi:hypothetical protein
MSQADGSITGCRKTSIRPSAKACGVLESAAYSLICEHLQKPHNAGSRPQALFFNTLLSWAGAEAMISLQNWLNIP